jgi:hypothetical protein
MWKKSIKHIEINIDDNDDDDDDDDEEQVEIKITFDRSRSPGNPNNIRRKKRINRMSEYELCSSK